MKISYMLKREDFYSINEQTLKRFFPVAKGAKTVLYIYPHLNAIVRRCPAKKVKQYIYTEFSVNGALCKRILVWLYTRLCLNSFGLLASKKLVISADISKNTLIYPCNRKIRIFDFDKDIVSVTAKEGFPPYSLQREIAFRTQCRPSTFILPIVSSSDRTYSEHIVDGVPLARIAEGRAFLEEKALKMWLEYAQDSRMLLAANNYAEMLNDQIVVLVEKIKHCKPAVSQEELMRVSQKFLSKLKGYEESVELVLSHGDLQAGNIWRENGTEQIYIIDWESVQQRSRWYDEAALYEGLRTGGGLDAFLRNAVDIRHTTVILEELIYRMNELCELPKEYGTKEFNGFLSRLKEE